MNAWRSDAVGRCCVLLRLALAGAGASCPLRRSGRARRADEFSSRQLEARDCGGHCPRVIVADGIIEEDTPEAFVGFLQSVADAPNLRRRRRHQFAGRAGRRLDALGAALRKLQAAVIVARFGDERRSNSPIAGQCMSACVYALMGGARRVGAAGQPARHPPHVEPGNRRRRAVLRRRAPPTLRADMVDALAGYAAQMGVSPTVIRVAERIPPEEIHIVSPAELRRWRLASPKF